MGVYLEYQKLIESGIFLPNSQQENLVKLLEKAENNINKIYPKSLWKSFLFSSSLSSKIQSFYIHGTVGQGKSKISQIFCDSLNTRRKIFVHYQTFLSYIHHNIHMLRIHNDNTAMSNTNIDYLKKKINLDFEINLPKIPINQNIEDKILYIAKNLEKHFDVIIIDEFEVLDITDAMIVKRIFLHLLKQGVFVLFTSNIMPENQYQNGIQRESFVPFIDKILSSFAIFSLNGKLDYRSLEQNKVIEGYFTLINKQNISSIIKKDFEHRYGQVFQDIDINDHSLIGIPKKVIVIDYEDLCNSAKFGTDDYRYICENTEIILITGLISMDIIQNRNEAIRFKKFIDIIYSHSKVLGLYSNVKLNEIFISKNSSLRLEFQRVLSRIQELCNI